VSDLKIYIGRKGKVVATYALAELILALEAERILHTDMAWYRGLSDWMPVSEAVPPILPLVPGRPIPTTGQKAAEISHTRGDLPSLAI
jgi:hypothetical protein